MGDIALYVEPKNGLYKEIKKSEYVSQIFERLYKIDGVKRFSDDIEFLTFVCQLIENVVDNKKYKFDKKEILLDVYIKIFGNIDKEKISKNIEYLIQNKKIKKIGFLKIFLVNFKEWIKRKVL